MRGAVAVAEASKAMASGSDGDKTPPFRCHRRERRRMPSLSGFCCTKPLFPDTSARRWRDGTKIDVWSASSAVHPGNSSASGMSGGLASTMRPTPPSRSFSMTCPYSSRICAVGLRCGSILTIKPFSSAFAGRPPASWSYRTRSAAMNHCASGPYISSKRTLTKASAIIRLRFLRSACFKTSHVPVLRAKL